MLAAGKPADICLYDPEMEWQLDAATMLSRGKNTPFEGWSFQGKVRHTIIDGNLTYTS